MAWAARSGYDGRMHNQDATAREGKGPFRADQLHEGDRYELHEGHAIYCAPTGARGSRRNLTAGSLLDSDPNVTEAGVDTGYSPKQSSLRAPDVAVGHVPDEPGWVSGAPQLALEYADVGQDERELQSKIVDLLGTGTRYVWVVRLVGPRRVEVYEPGRAMRTIGDDGQLHAPGVLANPVPVTALYDRDVAHELTLRNLLQRHGYAGLDDVRDRSKAEGKAEAVLAVLAARGVEVADEDRARVLACLDGALLDRWLTAAVSASSTTELLEPRS